MSAKRCGHIERVAALLSAWALALDLPASEHDRLMRAAFFHDALKDAPMDLLRELAPRAWGVDDLRHGPAAAEMAAQHGETDQGVLDAVRYHSLGYAGWDDVGRLLYLADFLEPHRPGDPSTRDRWCEQVPLDPRSTLRAVAATRLHLTVSLGQPLFPVQVGFWNALACGG